MKSIFYKIFGAVSILCLVAVSSCKKSDDSDLNFGTSTLTMTMDGKPWNATMAYMATVSPELDDEEYNNEDHYVVLIYGTEMELKGGEELENAAGLSIIFTVPKAKFKNPGGAYSFTNSETDIEQGGGFAYAAYASSVDEYNYGTVEGGGSLKIDKFKTGKASFFGLPIGEYEGYTHLTGTFSMTLTQIYVEEGETPKVIKITNGKFNVNNDYGLGGLFGQFSEKHSKVIEKLQFK